jgi:hypothetical protein
LVAGDTLASSLGDTQGAGVNSTSVPPMLLIPSISTLKSKPSNIVLIYLETVLLGFASAGGARFYEGAHCLVGGEKGSFVALIKVFIGKPFKILNILTFLNLTQLNGVT